MYHTPSVATLLGLPIGENMTFFDYYLLFAAKILSAIAIIGLVFSSKKNTKPNAPEIEYYNLSHLKLCMDTAKSLNKLSWFKPLQKQLKKELKSLKKADQHIFVLDFHGDMKATQVSTLRKEIDLILSIANPQDQVLLRLNSPGGTVTGYGLAASQVHRIRQAGLSLTIAIDEVAASGGYMIASLAHQIIAAPFACIGSIGVVYELPNFNAFLAKRGIEYNQVTAGKYKRTLSLLGKNTKEGETKVKEDIEMTHELFKAHVSQYRELDLEQIATGETWPAMIAHEKGLVDKIYTSDEYISDHLNTHAILLVKTTTNKGLLTLLKAKTMNMLHSFG